MEYRKLAKETICPNCGVWTDSSDIKKDPNTKSGFSCPMCRPGSEYEAEDAREPMEVGE